MRNQNFNPDSFFRQLDHQLYRIQESGQLLRTRVVDSPNFLSGNWKFVNLPSKLSEIEALAIISWWLPIEIGVLLRLQLEEKLKFLAPEDQIVLTILLSSRAEMQIFLSETSLWSTRDFFGNILMKGIRAFQRLEFRKIITKVQKPQRKRGYHDHGALRPAHSWLPTNDWSLTEEQNRIEKERSNFKQIIKFLKGFIT